MEYWSSIHNSTSAQLALALVVVGGAVVYWRKRRAKYVNPYSVDYEKDMIYLHMFPRKYTKKVPNLSPFAIKIEAWLRLHNIKYKVNINYFVPNLLFMECLVTMHIHVATCTCLYPW